MLKDLMDSWRLFTGWERVFHVGIRVATYLAMAGFVALIVWVVAAY